ncbi:hypothetical protein Tco_1080385, partial [Tanacetum coccineum]
IQRISLIGFPAQSVGSSNTYVSDSPCLLVLITRTSQSKQYSKSESNSYYPVITSLIHIESCKSPTKSLFDVGLIGMDKSKITRKQSKTGKHGHGNQKSSKRSQRFKAEARKAKP